ncbi:MAG: YbhN family protein [Cyclobacteriaceae bacterium]
MDLDTKKILKTLNPNKVWVPVALGLAIVVYMFVSDPEITFERLSYIMHARPLPLVLAILVLLARDAGYVYRIRTITDENLSWVSSIYVIILWEFSSAVTPSIVGGTAVAVFILWKEGINLGKSLAYVMLTAIFDNLFFVVAAPLALFFAGTAIFPASATAETILGRSLTALFYTSYGLITIYTLVMALALFFRPRLFKWLLIKITSLKYLRKWRYAAYERGNEILWASAHLRGKKATYWLKISLSPIFIWSARYAMVNCIIAAFNGGLTIFDHTLIFGKHIILWIVMLISPTPGSSGTAEFFFPMFFRIYLENNALLGSLVWRILTYYPYLLLGAIFLPKWIRMVFLLRKNKATPKTNS